MGVKWKAGAKEMEAEMNKLIELKKKKKHLRTWGRKSCMQE